MDEPTVISSYKEYVDYYGGAAGLPLVTRRDYEVAAKHASRWVRRVTVHAGLSASLPLGVVEIRVRGPLGVPLPQRVKEQVVEAIDDRRTCNVELRVR